MSGSFKKALDFDPVTGISHTFHYDAATDQATIAVEQEVGDILEANKVAFNNAPTRWGEWSHVGSIPMSVYAELLRSGKLHDQEYMKRWLNDGDHSKFRTRPGTI